jgi:hypothetical protein
MYAEFYAQNPLLFWPLVGLVIFLISFTAVLFYVFIGLRDQRKVDYLSSLPLEADSQLPVESRDVDVADGRA